MRPLTVRGVLAAGVDLSVDGKFCFGFCRCSSSFTDDGAYDEFQMPVMVNLVSVLLRSELQAQSLSALIAATRLPAQMQQMASSH